MAQVGILAFMTDPAPIHPSDAMASLKLSVDLVNSERQVVWSRTAAMLVANSFIINALGGLPESMILHTVIALSGILLCFIWEYLYLTDGGFIDVSQLLAGRFPLIND